MQAIIFFTSQFGPVGRFRDQIEGISGSSWAVARRQSLKEKKHNKQKENKVTAVREKEITEDRSYKKVVIVIFSNIRKVSPVFVLYISWGSSLCYVAPT